jgi:hypothetical protein
MIKYNRILRLFFFKVLTNYIVPAVAVIQEEQMLFFVNWCKKFLDCIYKLKKKSKLKY